MDEQAVKAKPKFDWVTERSARSLPKVFQQLRAEIEDDIKIRNGLRPKNAPYEFSVELRRMALEDLLFRGN